QRRSNVSEHRAYLAVAPGPVFDKLSDIAKKNGFDVHRNDETMRIDAPLGTVDMQSHKTGTEVAFAARTAAELQLLKELYAQRFSALGFDDGIRWSGSGERIPLNQTLCQVERSEQISPNFQRVRLSGDFQTYAGEGVGLHFRFLFGPDGAGWPTLDANGLTDWPGGMKAWHRPSYTVRKMSPDCDWIDVDIVLHEGGRVTEWSRHAQRGDAIALHGPSGSKQPVAGHLALFGDETALPVILQIVETAPSCTKGHAILLVSDMRDAQAVETASAIEVEWSSSMGLVTVKSCLASLEFPVDDRHFFFAGERASAADMRATFLAHGLNSSEFKSASYWTRSP
ncbi:MAG: siderophore-interacting protein, partial [Pseudomonadota bacterium]